MGSDIHNKGASLREEDKHLDALGYLTLSLFFLQQEGNYSELVDALKDRCLTWKHLFLTLKDKSYSILARKDAESMLAITEEFNLIDRYHTSYFRLGEIDMLDEDYPNAIKNYQKALETYTGTLSEKGDYRYHLGEAKYRKGDKKEGKGLILKGLEEIRKGAKELDPFLIHVWESGVHMRLAELLRKDEPKESKLHLQKAQEIANSDEKLVIRRRQIKELTKKLNF
ncbi:hypothetical protein A2W13_02830 [Candidatus Woesebacteria bacterium RBG_16_36_11]|uniref:Tetratricopeptide SHNi-TPR domain-containing protein n=2 Tax=Candidatus Woeseibacteriota TaxID=1752722 RepID=A0A1F7X9Q4_9BACT|nr:MAG: hypothetical protein A2W13_02830 [Candidatus Woesebacteria bacterium RBG_16_36_11]OGM17159.1 MAG: hypothetical protein A2V55_00455 [Candidatus Woesebacteria bacterium RBG_19FT_COMBO_37_29]